jgi:hypothetical protein
MSMQGTREPVENEAVMAYEVGVEELFLSLGTLRLDSSLGVVVPEREEGAVPDHD